MRIFAQNQAASKKVKTAQAWKSPAGKAATPNVEEIKANIITHSPEAIVEAFKRLGDPDMSQIQPSEIVAALDMCELYELMDVARILNKNASSKTAQTIHDDGFADGGAAYTDEEMDLIGGWLH
jgi:hypothetical protein